MSARNNLVRSLSITLSFVISASEIIVIEIAKACNKMTPNCIARFRTSTLAMAGQQRMEQKIMDPIRAHTLTCWKINDRQKVSRFGFCFFGPIGSPSGKRTRTVESNHPNEAVCHRQCQRTLPLRRSFRFFCNSRVLYLQCSGRANQ